MGDDGVAAVGVVGHEGEGVDTHGVIDNAEGVGVGTIERGEKSSTLNTIVKIANALGISKSQLFNY